MKKKVNKKEKPSNRRKVVNLKKLNKTKAIGIEAEEKKLTKDGCCRSSSNKSSKHTNKLRYILYPLTQVGQDQRVL